MTGIEKFVEKPANLIVAVGLACGTIWAALTYIPRFFRLIKIAYDKLLEVSNILDTLNRIEEAQHEANHIRGVMLDADPLRAYFKADSHGSFIWTSHVFQALTGLTEQECKGSGWENGIAESDRERFLKEWKAAVDHQRNFSGTAVLCDRNGNLIPTRIFASIIWASDHSVRGFFGFTSIISTGAGEATAN